MLNQIIGQDLSFWNVVVLIISYLAIILVALPIHEWAHGFVASKLGDPTPRMYGRLTLNPFAHLDIAGTLMLVVFGFGFAKPVPVDPRYFRKPRTGMVLVALAGPLSNLIVAFLAAGAYRLLLLVNVGGMATYLLAWFFFSVAHISISLAVFNLLPIPPLDGYRIISPLLPAKWTYYVNRYQMYATIAVLALLATDALDIPLNFLRDLFSRLVFGVYGL